MERIKKALRTEGAWKSSDLLRLMQKIAAEDATRRGGGQALLTSRGCTWVLVRNRLEVSRWPQPGEELTLTTWPIQGRLKLYPRCILLTDSAGEELVRTESLWAIMDVESRTMISGEERGIVMETEEGRFRPPRRIAVPEGGTCFEFVPLPEQIDENGHMNNAAYLDAVDPMLPADLRGKTLRCLQIEYEHEILPGCCASVRAVREGESCFFEGSAEGKTCFRLREDFAV